MWGEKVAAEFLKQTRDCCEFNAETPCEAVVDSGTSLLAVPTPIFPELYEMLRPASLFGSTLQSPTLKEQPELESCNGRSPASLEGECSTHGPKFLYTQSVFAEYNLLHVGP